MEQVTITNRCLKCRNRGPGPYELVSGRRGEVIYQAGRCKFCGNRCTVTVQTESFKDIELNE